MQVILDGQTIFYAQEGKGQDIILLPGWGQNIEMMLPLANRLKNNYRTTTIELPGFGKSPEPSYSYTIYDYEEMLDKVLKELKIKNPIVLGHSFGGRVCICYAANHKVEKVVLLGAPCIRDEQVSTSTKFLKKLAHIPLLKDVARIAKNYLGSEDYKKASPRMKEVLVNVVNQDLSEEAKRIEAPTLLIWGTLDTAAPIEKARQLETIMKDAALIEIPNATHYAYLEATDYVVSILNNFFGGKK